MSESSNSASGNAPPKKASNFRKFRFSNRFNAYNRNSEPRVKPVSIEIATTNYHNSNRMDSESTISQLNPGEPNSYRIVPNQKCEYPGWKLYFPEEGLY